MEEDDAENILQLEVPHVTESDKIKSRLKKFCYVIGFLFILWIISIIIISTANKIQVQNNNISWEEANEKAGKFISTLNSTQIKGLLNCTNNINSTINETNNKLCQGQISDSKNISFKGMCLQEVKTGVGFSNGTGILWQSEINTAATFNKKLMYEIGRAQGEESREKGINTLLSPCVNIMRNNNSGILWESFGENPFYSGICASEIIKGIQDSGVISTIKFFLGNDLNTDDSFKNKDLMGDYLEPFYRAIHDIQVGSVMVSNNCYENENLLTHILRKILNFKGFTISDLWDKNDNQNINCSLLDLNIGKKCAQELSKEMNENDTNGTNHSYFPNLKDYEKNKRDNESAQRIIAAMYKMNQMEDYPEVNLYKEIKNDERKKIQREAAIESQVLLKNDDILPLKDNLKIVVIGNISMKGDCGFEETNEKKSSVNADTPLGDDSSSTKIGCFISPLEEIKVLAQKKNITVMSFKQFLNKTKINLYKAKEKNDSNIIEEIKQYLNKSNEVDVAIVFVNASSYENYSIIDDGLAPNFWNVTKELISIFGKYKKVIVVINALTFEEPCWLQEVNALLFSGYPGDEASQVIADILFGEVNPSGHLPFKIKFNKNCSDLSFLDHLQPIETKIEKIKKDELKFNEVVSAVSFGKIKDQDMKRYNYSKGLTFDKRLLLKKATIFHFGYGLSYSSFDYTDLKLSMSKEGLTAEFSIKNESPNLGKAVPMMFLTFPKNKGNYHEHIFRGFEKFEIKPDETIKVKIFADDHALSYFNATEKKYIRVCKGKIKVFIAENGDISETKLMAQINAKC